jgi:hypothetical protein
VQQRRIPLHAGLLPPDASPAEALALTNRARDRAAQLLGIHAARSFPAAAAPPAAEGATARRALRCSRRRELHALCCELLIADKAYLQKVGAPHTQLVAMPSAVVDVLEGLSRSWLAEHLFLLCQTVYLCSANLQHHLAWRQLPPPACRHRPACSIL